MREAISSMARPHALVLFQKARTRKSGCADACAAAGPATDDHGPPEGGRRGEGGRHERPERRRLWRALRSAGSWDWTPRDHSLQPGSVFPDCTLTDHAGNRRALSDLVAGDPAVLQFYRGWWCPKEQAFFRRLVAFQDEVEVAYARIISVSVDPPPVTAAF